MFPESPKSIDRHVGRRVRKRRLMLEMSQTRLGDALGVTCQQVRRYEKGTDRVEAGQLLQLSKILKEPVLFFFEALPHAPAGADDASGALGTASVFDTKAVVEGWSLVKSFMQVRQPRLRRRIIKMVKEIAADARRPSDTPMRSGSERPRLRDRERANFRN